MGATETTGQKHENTLKNAGGLPNQQSNLVFVIQVNAAKYELAVPELTLTCGWLLSEVIRKGADETVVALRTAANNEAQDYWLMQYDRPLLPFSDKQTFEAVHRQPVSPTVSRSHFEIIKLIGVGGFSRVLQVRKIDSGELFAMKSMSKAFIKSEDKVAQVASERRIMEWATHPFIVALKWAFQSDHELHLVMDFCPGGELFFHLHNLGRFTEAQAKFYFGEIVLALKYLHSLNIVYRDLKPENVLLDLDGHIKLTDFGLAKEDIDVAALSNSYCGSPEYMSPEMLKRKGHGRAVDFFSLGALLFEMLTGLPPFYSRNRAKMFARIKKEPLVVPEFVSDKARSLITGLLAKEPQLRLGAGQGLEEVMQHPWCSRIKWGKLLRKKILPPFRPNLKLSNFDPECTSATLPEIEDTGQVDLDFKGFDYDCESSKTDSTKSSETRIQSFYAKDLLSIDPPTLDLTQRHEVFRSLKPPENSFRNTIELRPAPLSYYMHKRKASELPCLINSSPNEEIKNPHYRKTSPKPPLGGHFKQIRVQQPKTES